MQGQEQLVSMRQNDKIETVMLGREEGLEVIYVKRKCFVINSDNFFFLQSCTWHYFFSTSVPIADQPLVLRLDLKDLHCPFLLSVQSFGFFAFPLQPVRLGSGVAKNHSLVTQHGLQIMFSVLSNALLQERLGENFCFRGGPHLKIKQYHQHIRKKTMTLFFKQNLFSLVKLFLKKC